MPIDHRPGNDPVADHLRRMGDSVHELSARIARLATTLRVDLENEADLERVLHIDAVRVPVPDRRVTPDRRAASRASMSPDRRQAHLREELRGLLVLRYGVARSYVNRVGVDATRHIVVATHEQLVREGFKPGAAGASLRRLFDTD
ncbi:hypothetical protein [Simplicispira lacusdiani]|uniref:hypothetical protein n=1 Tax=Simplicispira lacusdiani TaxID=2213010 RepID=UPI000E7548FB|nr:hypothetical protein [Simplicispira lacusdiani]